MKLNHYDALRTLKDFHLEGHILHIWKHLLRNYTP